MVTVTDVVIALGATLSDEFKVPTGWDFSILAPAVLPETVTILVAETSGGTFRTLQSDLFDITIGAGKAVPFVGVPAEFFKLQAGGAVAGTRTFHLLHKSLKG